MIATIIIGILFLAYFVWAFNRSRKSITSNKCAGCSAGCAQAQKDKCNSH